MNTLKLYILVTIPVVFFALPLLSQQEVFVKNINSSSFYEKGIDLHDNGATVEAVAHYSEALRMDESNQKALYNRGLANFQLEKYNKAIIDFTKLIEFAPEDKDAYEQRGRLFFLIGDYPSAVLDYTKALSFGADNLLFVNRAMSYLEMQKFETALQDFSMAAQINPNDSEVYNGMADAEFALNNFKEAIVLYDRALEINPNDVRALNNRANSFGKAGLHESAEAGYTKALQLHQGTNIYTNRAFYYMEQDNYKLAMLDFVEATRLSPKNANAFYGVGWINLEWGNYEMAIENLDKALELDGNKPIFFVKRGLAYFHNGDYEDAIYDYEIAIEKGADFQETKKLITECKAAMSQGYAPAKNERVEYLSYEIVPSEYEEAPAPPTYSLSAESLPIASIQEKEASIEEMEPEFINEIRKLTELTKTENTAKVDEDESFGYFENNEDLNSANRIAFDEFTPKGVATVPPVMNHTNPILVETLNTDLISIQPKESKGDRFAKKIDNSTLLLIAKRNHKQGFRSQALNDYNFVLAKDSLNYEAHSGKGALLFEMEKTEEALYHLNTACRLAPNKMEAFLNRGNLLKGQGNQEQAILDYTHVVRLSPDFAKAYLKRGQSFALLGQNLLAKQDFDNCLSLDPDNVKALNNRATVRFRTGNLFGAEQDYNTGIQKDSSLQTLYANRAKLKMQQELFQAANKDLRKAIQIGEPNEELLYYIGANAYELKDYKASIKFLTQSLKENPDFSKDVYYRRALAFYKMKKYRMALADYNQVLLMDQAHKEAYYNRAICKKKLKDREGACADFMEAGNLGLFKAFEQKNVSYCNGVKVEEEMLSKH